MIGCLLAARSSSRSTIGPVWLDCAGLAERGKGKMKRSVTILTMAAVLASLLVALPQARIAHAWKPPTHLFGVEDALQDVIQNGSVTIHPIDGSAAITVPVDQTIKDALTQFPAAYRRERWARTPSPICSSVR